jgi:hypothetical protein
VKWTISPTGTPWPEDYSRLNYNTLWNNHCTKEPIIHITGPVPSNLIPSNQPLIKPIPTVVTLQMGTTHPDSMGSGFVRHSELMSRKIANMLTAPLPPPRPEGGGPRRELTNASQKIRWLRSASRFWPKHLLSCSHRHNKKVFTRVVSKSQNQYRNYDRPAPGAAIHRHLASKLISNTNTIYVVIIPTSPTRAIFHPGVCARTLNVSHWPLVIGSGLLSASAQTTHYLRQCSCLSCNTGWLATKIGSRSKLDRISWGEGRYTKITKKLRIPWKDL